MKKCSRTLLFGKTDTYSWTGLVSCRHRYPRQLLRWRTHGEFVLTATRSTAPQTPSDADTTLQCTTFSVIHSLKHFPVFTWHMVWTPAADLPVWNVLHNCTSLCYPDIGS